MALTGGLAAAYSATGGRWDHGPGRIYDRLAEVLVHASPVPLRGARALDVGAGTGAATRALLKAGAASVVAVDVASGMLAHDSANRPPAAVGDATALPFRASAFDAAVAAFCLNHLGEPAAGLHEMCRVTRLGGAILAASYAADDGHEVKAATEEALSVRGWRPEPWYLELQKDANESLATLEHAAAAAEAAGLDAEVGVVRVGFEDLDVHDLVAWRLGLAQHAPFLSRLPPVEREAVAADAAARLGEHVSPLVRSMLVVRAIRS